MGNPLVALQVRNPVIESPFRRMASLQSLRQGNQLQQQQIESNQAKQQAAEQAAKKQAAVDQIISDAGSDIRKALPNIMQVDPETGMEYQEYFAKQDKLSVELQLKNNELSIEKNRGMAQLAQGVRDQVSRDAAIDRGVELKYISPENGQQWKSQPYDPEKIKGTIKSALTGAQFYTVENNRLVRAETARRNLAKEGKPQTPTSKERDFQTWYANVREARGLPKNAKVEMELREEYNRSGRAFSTQSDIKEAAKAISEGQATPVLSRYDRTGRTALVAELRRLGYNQAEAELDWYATSRHLSSLNSTQQMRLRQAIDFTKHSLGMVEDAFGDWQKTGLPSGFRLWNKVALAAAKQLPGEAGARAQVLDALINDLVAELAVVYRGGNASTDEAMQLAAENLGADWNEKTLNKAIGMLRRTLTIRQNSINSSQAMGVTEGSPYERPAGRGGTPERVTATNPETGETVEWDGSKWVPVQ